MIGTTNISNPICRTSMPPNGGFSVGGTLKFGGGLGMRGSGAFSVLGTLHPEFEDIT
jgi:hypothetical protein